VAVAALVFLGLAWLDCLLVWRYRVWFPWLTIGCIQVPVAFAWGLWVNLRNTSDTREPLEAESMGEPSAHRVRGSEAPTKAVLQPGVGEAGDSPRPPPIPNHQMLRCIGQGAYGEVWLARDEIGTYHAVKVVYRKSFDDSGPFDREFRGIQQYTPISRTHHGLVRILRVGRNKEAGYFFYVMELGDCEVRGQKVVPETYCARNLGRELDLRGKLPVKECVHLAMELAEALHYLHSKQLIHRDIKPSNIIFVNGIPKFADVGLVTHMAEKGRDVSRLGTEGFIAPEGPGTPAADIYSLGKVIYEACLGRSASHYPEAPTSLTLSGDEEDLLQLNEIILKACDRDLRRRYKTATELQTDLMHLNDRLYGGVQRAHQ
jgi:serine/threonine protein kinase